MSTYCYWRTKIYVFDVGKKIHTFRAGLYKLMGTITTFTQRQV